MDLKKYTLISRKRCVKIMNSLSRSGESALVVGGAGFVGSNLVIRLLEQGIASVVIVDNLMSSESANIPKDPRVSFLHGSIANPLILNRLPEKIDFVWHLACYHGNQASIADPIADHDNNTLTSLMLFDALSKRGNVKKVVYAAAGCAVAEKTADSPLATPEDAPISLFHDSPYSISKIIGEMYGNYYFQASGLPFVRARFQNVYGPREILGAGQWRGTPATVWRNVVPTFIWKAIQGENLVLDNEGTSSRDFIFVSDIVSGLVACALRGQAGEAYNLASGKETTVLDLANQVLRLVNSKSEIRLAPRRPWDNSIRRFGSVTKSENQLGFKSETSLDEGLARTVEWTLENKEMILSSISKHDFFAIEKK
jgi:nucleoside-diphosphate-sugar epimerase